MKAFLALARLRVFDVVRSRSATLAFLGLPLVILLVLVLVFANGHPFETRRLTLVEKAGQLASARSVLARYDGLLIDGQVDLNVARRQLQTRATNAVLWRDEHGGLTLEVGEKEQLWGRGLLSVLPGARLAPVALERFGYVQFLFPGLLCSSVMFAGMFGMGYAMARYRRNGFLKKLATMPLGRATFVLAQIGGRGSLVVAQVSLLLLFGVVGLGLRPSFTGLACACLVWLLGLFVFSGIGFLLASLIETEAVVADLISGLTLPFTLFSGVFFPIDSLPRWLGLACSVLPSTLMVDGVRGALLYDVELVGVAGKLLGLLGWAALTFGLSVRLFRWHE
ncbi:MAG TPA: ABC transporter permease [Polyangiaceae bacterium]|nr:ABC transporter permease [Polyangiaceae bacterium]